MEEHELRGRLLAITALATRYCQIMQTAGEYERQDFVSEVLGMLPRLYWEFLDLQTEGRDLLSPGEEAEESYADYVDEDYYESIRRQAEMVLGEQDTYLETFEEDMKYSDTPIGASIAEGLADIFQPLFNFISVVKDTDGDSLEGAYRVCREKFTDYWAQTLCNVMRPLNSIKFNPAN